MQAHPTRHSSSLAAAEIGPLDELRQAQLVRLRAQIVFARRRGIDAPPLLLDAANRLEQLDNGHLAAEVVRAAARLLAR
jgi:hypothetical protein